MKLYLHNFNSDHHGKGQGICVLVSFVLGHHEHFGSPQVQPQYPNGFPSPAPFCSPGSLSKWQMCRSWTLVDTKSEIWAGIDHQLLVSFYSQHTLTEQRTNIRWLLHYSTLECTSPQSDLPACWSIAEQDRPNLAADSSDLGGNLYVEWIRLGSAAPGLVGLSWRRQGFLHIWRARGGI